MNMKKLLFCAFLILVYLGGQAQVSKGITLTAGTLSTVLTLADKQKVTDLTIRGTIDARDFKTLRDELLDLSSLNLASATIVAYSGTQGPSGSKSTFYPANTVPANAFNKSLTGNRAVLTSCTLPTSITAIGLKAFEGCYGLETITLPEGILSIGDRAFNGCYVLSGISFFPSTLQSIGDFAFLSCENLATSLSIPESVMSLGEGAFESCRSLERISVEASISALGKRVFSQCHQLIEINLPPGITEIGDSAFYYCNNLEEFIFPDSLKIIGEGSFLDCQLQYVLMPDALLSIGAEAFRNNHLRFFNIPSRVSFIGDHAFRGTIMVFQVNPDNLFFSANGGGLLNKDQTLLIRGSKDNIMVGPGSYSIPETVETIGDFAFESFGYMDQVNIPSRVTRIGLGAFYNCDANRIVIDNMDPSGIECNESFSSWHILDVPYGTKDLYEALEPWNHFFIREGWVLELSTRYVSASDTDTQTYEVTVDANNFWITVADESWAHVSPNGTVFGDSILQITVDQNLGEQRTAHIIVMSSQKTDTVFVTQQKMHAPVFSSDSIVLGASDNRTSELTVTSIYSWIASSDQSWLSVSPVLPVQGSGELTLSAQPNTGPERTATVTVIAEGSLHSISVTQLAGDGSGICVFDDYTHVLYPNPATRSFRIRGAGTGDKIKIHDLNGKTLWSGFYIPEQPVDISFLPKGIYRVTVQGCSDEKTFSLMKK